MSKPTFILCPAFAKSGTSSLYWTLYEKNFCIHFGHDKEPQYLTELYLNSYNNSIIKSDIERLNSIYSQEVTFLPIQHDFRFSPNPLSLESYCQYYLKLWDNVKGLFYGVGDFSQMYHTLPENCLEEVRDYLSQHFTIKVILLARDPIRRLFSYSHMLMELGETNGLSAKEFFHQCLDDDYYKGLYFDVRDKYKRVFGEEEVITIAMEDLFDPECFDEKNRLINFLNLPPIHIDYSEKRLEQNYTEFLTEEDVEIAKKKFRGVYVAWFKKFGKLPKKWYNAEYWNKFDAF